MKLHKNNRGVTLVELLAVLVISSILMIAMSRLVVFLFKMQNLTYTTNRLINEGGIITQEIVQALNEEKPDTITFDGTTLTLSDGDATPMTVAIGGTSGDYEIILNGTAIEHTTVITDLVITEMLCANCPSEKLFKVEFTLSLTSDVLSTGTHTKKFVTSLPVFRGF